MPVGEGVGRGVKKASILWIPLSQFLNVSHQRHPIADSRPVTLDIEVHDCRDLGFWLLASKGSHHVLICLGLDI